MFSDFTVASSVTSLGIIPSIAQYSNLINNITKALFCTKELESILVVAYEDPDIGAERLQTNARRMIQHLGNDLKSEADDKIQLDTSRALKTRKLSKHAARLVVHHMNGTMAEPATKKSSRLDLDDVITLESGGSSSDSLDEDDEKDLSTTEYRDIHNFLVNSRAYDTFKADLLEFMHKPYERRVLSAIGRHVVGPCGAHLDQDAISFVAREISWVPTRLLEFSNDTLLSYGDRVKGFIEDRMEETWNWWPLAPRQHRLRPGYRRLKWISVCVQSPVLFL
jgi:hypothetical protein